jgi:hypothetical protein
MTDDSVDLRFFMLKEIPQEQWTDGITIEFNAVHQVNNQVQCQIVDNI